jgi:plasmid stabilization system protein ParE
MEELTVYWTSFAEDKLNNIFEYYVVKASVRIAKKLVLGIIERTINLDKNPYMGQKEELLADRPQGFRYLVYKNYKIVYWINTGKSRIEIVNVFDCRQNPEKMNDMI